MSKSARKGQSTPKASGKNTKAKEPAAKEQAPEEFRLSNSQEVKAADLAKAINTNFEKGDDQQAIAAILLLAVRDMFPEGRPGNALFQDWCAEHISQSYKTVSNLLSHARKGNKTAVLASINAAREAAKTNWHKAQARKTAALDLHNEDKTQDEATCRKAISATKADDGTADMAKAREWLKEHKAEPAKEASEPAPETPGFEGICRPVRNAIKSAGDKMEDLAVHLIVGLSKDQITALHNALWAAEAAAKKASEEAPEPQPETEQPAPTNHVKEDPAPSESPVDAIKNGIHEAATESNGEAEPDKGTGNPLAIPAFLDKRGGGKTGSKRDADQEPAQAAAG